MGSIPTLGTILTFFALFDPKRLPKVTGKWGNRCSYEVAMPAGEPRQ